MQIPKLDKFINSIPFVRAYIISFESYNALFKECHKAKEDLYKKEKELQFQKEINEILSKRSKIVTVVGFDDNDAEPNDLAKRIEYVKEVDVFYDNILKKKLTTSIADIRELLSNIHVANGFPQNMQRDQYDYFLRGMEAFAWKINEWAINLQGERRQSLQDKENEQ